MRMKIDVKPKTENGRTNLINNLKHWHENLKLMTIQVTWYKVQTKLALDLSEIYVLLINVTVKQEILDDDDDEDVKPRVEACKIKFHKEPEVTKLEKPELLVVQDVLQSKEPEFIFLQVCL